MDFLSDATCEDQNVREEEEEEEVGGGFQCDSVDLGFRAAPGEREQHRRP